ncbi:hypothetical protein ACX64L_13665 [Pseudomonas monsensis]
MNQLTFTSVCMNNGLIIFDALSIKDLQTGRRLYSDVTDYTSAIGRSGYCTRYQVTSVASLHAYLMAVLSECKSGVLKPILHFEGHGHPEKGMYISASDEYISWTDLQRQVGQINRATRNNAGVVVAACHGFSLSAGLKINSPSPFNFLVAPKVEMSAGAFQDTMSNFYKMVASSGDLAAGLSGLSMEMQLLVSGEWFYSNLGTYLIHHHTQKNRQEMLETVVSREMDKASAANRAERRASLKHARKSVKNKLYDPSGFTRHFAKIFFHGDPPIALANFQGFIKAQKELHL